MNLIARDPSWVARLDTAQKPVVDIDKKVGHIATSNGATDAALDTRPDSKIIQGSTMQSGVIHCAMQSQQFNEL